ncbi:hypothetical protein, partial [Fischerella thermalis]|uniref:hypothetical protein n=1 Tax=Fischerella thermalis TaxID=372787 RepID=UPI00241D069E
LIHHSYNVKIVDCSNPAKPLNPHSNYYWLNQKEIILFVCGKIKIDTRYIFVVAYLLSSHDY